MTALAETPSASAARTARLLALLPQTHCQACGEAGCVPFATALEAGRAQPAACTPGGALVAQRISRVLDLPPVTNVLKGDLPPRPLLAVIHEDDCIGCTKCLPACPVDALMGAPRVLHEVLSADCTGCGLCLPPCPVDCIELIPSPLDFNWPENDDAALGAVRTGADIASCTDCGRCTPACPEGLAPAALARLLAAGDLVEAEAQALSRCTHCGDCAPVCPQGIPLPAYFSLGQTLVQIDQRQRSLAIRSAARHARLLERRARPLRETASYVPPPVDEHVARDAVAAALERVRQRRQTGGGEA